MSSWRSPVTRRSQKCSATPRARIKSGSQTAVMPSGAGEQKELMMPEHVDHRYANACAMRD